MAMHTDGLVPLVHVYPVCDWWSLPHSLDGRDYDVTTVTVTGFQQTVTGFDILPF